MATYAAFSVMFGVISTRMSAKCSRGAPAKLSRLASIKDLVSLTVITPIGW